PSRAQTRESWAIGSPYLGTIEETARVDRQRGIRPFSSGPTYDALLLILGACLVYAGVRVLHPALLLTRGTDVSGLVVLLLSVIAVLVLVWPMARLLWQAAKQAALPASAYRGGMLAVAKGLESRGEIRPVGAGNIKVTPMGKRRAEAYTVSVTGGTRQVRALCMDTFGELFPAFGAQRCILELGATDLHCKTWPAWLCSRLAMVVGRGSGFFACPRIIGRRRADAHAYAACWQEEVGPCRLHEIDSVEVLRLLTRARRRTMDPDARAVRHQVWS